MSKPIWIKWAYRYGKLEAEPFDSLDDALGMAEAAADDGTESLDCIEGPDGVVPSDVIDAFSRDRAARIRASYARQRKPSHVILLTSPSGKPGRWSTYYTADDADDAAAALRGRFGDRVVVKPL